jgi:hypothetical protein
VEFFLDHLQLEEEVIIPEAEKVLTEADWEALDAAFVSLCDPVTGKILRDPLHERLLSRFSLPSG